MGTLGIVRHRAGTLRMFLVLLVSFLFVLSISVIGVDGAYIDYTTSQGKWDGDPIFYDWDPVTHETFEGYAPGSYGVNITQNTTIPGTSVFFSRWEKPPSGADDSPAMGNVSVVWETELEDNSVLFLFNDTNVLGTYNEVYRNSIGTSNKTDYGVCMEFDIWHDNIVGNEALNVVYYPFGFTADELLTLTANNTDVTPITLYVLPNGSIQVFATTSLWINGIDEWGWFHLAFGYSWHAATTSFPWSYAERYTFVIIPNGTTYSFLDVLENVSRPSEAHDATVFTQIPSNTGQYAKYYLDNIKFYNENISYWDVINSTGSISKGLSIMITPILSVMVLAVVVEAFGTKR